MLTHKWETENDFQHVALDAGLEIVSGSVRLDSTTLSGSIVSDIRDSTKKLLHYDDFIIDANIEDSVTSVSFYYRTGEVGEYIETMWSDWIEVTAPSERVENTILVFGNLAATDYPIKTLSGIYREIDWRDNDFSENFAIASRRSDYTVTISTPPDDVDNITVVYTPQNFIIEDGNRYFQWKCDMTSTTSGSTPVLNSVNVGFKTNIAHYISRAFPSMYRRI